MADNNKQQGYNPTPTDYQNFKKLLEYFVAHLEVYKRYGSVDDIKSKKSFNELEIDDQKKKALEASGVEFKDFKWAGQSFRGSNIDKQIDSWNTYTGFMRIGISIRADNFKFGNKGIYLHWLGTGVNVKAIGDDCVNFLEIVNVDSDSKNSYKSATLTDLGLFAGSQLTNTLIDFFDTYYKAGKSALDQKQHYVKILTDHKNLILTGAPGTGKTYMAYQIAETIVGQSRDAAKPYIGFVQFHPSYDYTDFVEGLRPIQQGCNLSFRWHAGHFMNFCIKAANDNTNQKYVFIIDEINRGEINKIFGELFFSIDPGYREKKNRKPIRTQYADSQPGNVDDNGYEDPNGKKNPFKKDGFYVPENVYIIGTMNDIDRSVESLDFALRRRFAWEEVGWQDTIGQILDTKFKNSNISLDKQKEILRYFERLNAKIEDKEVGLGSAYCLGGSYISKFDTNNSDIEDAMKTLWDRFLKNIIKDYVRGLDNADSLYETLYKAYKGS